MTDTDESVRHAAAESLRRLAPKAPSAVPLLVKGSTDSSVGIRETCVRALGEVRPTKLVIEALIAALNDASPEVRCLAAQALGEHGHQATSAIPALTIASADPNGDVSQAAKAALSHITGKRDDQ